MDFLFYYETTLITKIENNCQKTILDLNVNKILQFTVYTHWCRFVYSHANLEPVSKISLQDFLKTVEWRKISVPIRKFQSYKVQEDSVKSRES